MTIRNLDFLFKPQSVTLIGASKRPGSVGGVMARNPLRSGFDVPVSPKHGAIERVLTYPDVASLPLVPALAVISTPTRCGAVHHRRSRRTRHQRHGRDQRRLRRGRLGAW